MTAGQDSPRGEQREEVMGVGKVTPNVWFRKMRRGMPEGCWRRSGDCRAMRKRRADALRQRKVTRPIPLCDGLTFYSQKLPPSVPGLAELVAPGMRPTFG